MTDNMMIGANTAAQVTIPNSVKTREPTNRYATAALPTATNASLNMIPPMAGALRPRATECFEQFVKLRASDLNPRYGAKPQWTGQGS